MAARILAAGGIAAALVSFLGGLATDARLPLAMSGGIMLVANLVALMWPAERSK